MEKKAGFGPAVLYVLFNGFIAMRLKVPTTWSSKV